MVFSQCAFDHLNNSLTPSYNASYSQNSISNNNNVGGAELNYPVSGTHNALIVFVQSKDDIYKDCRQFTGYDSSDGRPLFNDVSYNNCAPNGTLNPDSWQIGGYQSWDSDPVSEWPADLPNEGSDPAHMRRLPAWARNGFIDSINSTTITPNSLTEYYNQMSNGRFLLRGQVWPFSMKHSSYTSAFVPAAIIAIPYKLVLHISWAKRRTNMYSSIALRLPKCCSVKQTK